MQGFVKSYGTQTKDENLSQRNHELLQAGKLPVLTTLATEFAVFNRWFSSIPGPTICNRAFAHYGTSFGQVGMNVFYIGKNIDSIYGRMINAGKTAKIYYDDQQSSTMEIINLL
jgi:phospholipase C